MGLKGRSCGMEAGSWRLVVGEWSNITYNNGRQNFILSGFGSLEERG
jgi:hypothetical protein